MRANVPMYIGLMLPYPCIPAQSLCDCCRPPPPLGGGIRREKEWLSSKKNMFHSEWAGSLVLAVVSGLTYASVHGLISIFDVSWVFISSH
jgi:hypothetical protein